MTAVVESRYVQSCQALSSAISPFICCTSEYAKLGSLDHEAIEPETLFSEA